MEVCFKKIPAQKEIYCAMCELFFSWFVSESWEQSSSVQAALSGERVQADKSLLLPGCTCDFVWGWLVFLFFFLPFFFYAAAVFYLSPLSWRRPQSGCLTENHPFFLWYFSTFCNSLSSCSPKTQHAANWWRPQRTFSLQRCWLSLPEQTVSWAYWLQPLPCLELKLKKLWNWEQLHVSNLIPFFASENVAKSGGRIPSHTR